MKILTALLISLVISTANISAQSSAFTYQGRLTDAGAGPNVPFDFTFKLFAASSGGSQIGIDVLRDDVQVTNGIFTVSLDFGSSPFTSATGNYLEIWVRPGTQTGSYTQLLPRASITSSPYAVQTFNAAQLGGVAASQYVQTTDPRMTDARTPLAGSADYIQSNPATQQAATSLNIGGNATVGGTLSGNVVNATTQYNIGNQRVLASNEISGNLFVGHQTGPVTTTGNYNSFVGINAGLSNTTGYLNSFFGAFAGASNTDGSGNVFLGQSAGASNTTGYNNAFVGSGAGQNSSTAVNNTFFGASAGLLNTTGSQNAFLGMGAGVSNSTGFNNSFVGYASGARNTTGIYNSFVGVESGFESTTGDRNTFVGSVAGRSNTTGGRNSFFGTDAGFSNTTANENAYFGFEAGKNNTIGNSNAFFGTYAGRDNTASANAFFGFSAGMSNTSANFNAFFGHSAGMSNTSGNGNAFFGASAGRMNTTAPFNAFFGSSAGQNTVDGGENAFFGNSAGLANTSGDANSFFGRRSGAVNTTGRANSFFGYNAGVANISGLENTFIGIAAGDTNTTGSFNTVVGSGADVAANNLNFATAIGASAVVSTSNTIALGRSAGQDTVRVPGNLNVTGSITGNFTVPATNITGILALVNGGTGSATKNFVDLSTAQTIGGDKTFSNTVSGNVVNAATQFNLGGDKMLSAPNGFNMFVGRTAGSVNTGFYNSFFGDGAGPANAAGGANAFFGTNAGQSNTGGSSNTFLGAFAGQATTTGSLNTFIGAETGPFNESGLFNTFIGARSGSPFGQSGLVNVTAIGALASVTQNNSLILGSINGVNTATADTRVGIGTTAPQQKLHVDGDTEILSSGTGAGFKFRDRGSTSFNDDWVWYSDGNIAKLFRAGVGNLITVTTGGIVTVSGLGAAGSTSLCRNALNQISTCTAGNRTPDKDLDGLREQITKQQVLIDELKKIVCGLRPEADVCKERGK
jgi:hypothetical protein